MNIDERDKFLFEFMGDTWHKSVYTGRGNECICGKWWSECSKTKHSFSTWEGFGKLSSYMAFKVIGSVSVMKILQDCYLPFDDSLPNRFANAVYKLLHEGNDE
jgi:hypothetical protein